MSGFPEIKTVQQLVDQDVIPLTLAGLHSLAREYGIGKKPGRTYIFQQPDIDMVLKVLDDNSRPAQLYRIYNSAGDLLYIGISLSIMQRLSNHQHGKSWYLEIARIDVQQFAKRSDAIRAERAAIRQERPLHNQIYNNVDEVVD